MAVAFVQTCQNSSPGGFAADIPEKKFYFFFFFLFLGSLTHLGDFPLLSYTTDTKAQYRQAECWVTLACSKETSQRQPVQWLPSMRHDLLSCRFFFFLFHPLLFFFSEKILLVCARFCLNFHFKPNAKPAPCHILNLIHLTL